MSLNNSTDEVVMLPLENSRSLKKLDKLKLVQKMQKKASPERSKSNESKVEIKHTLTLEQQN